MFTRTLIIAAVVPASLSSAAVITFSGPEPQTGTGFGNILNVLALQGTPQEAGAVIRQNGMDVLLGAATPQSQTRTVSEYLALGYSPGDFGVIFNINEPGSSPNVLLQEFEVLFYDASDTLLFTAQYSGPALNLAPLGQGQGGSGYLFDIAFTPAELDFFNDPNNRIGLRVTTPILDTAAGAESFYIIPAPGSAALLGFVALASVRRRR